jgi:[ribosomal protein S18]-alanine N-acetyltransferase
MLLGDKALMTRSELSLRLARLTDAGAIANLSREFIEYGLRWRWTPMRVAASIRAANVNVLVACATDRVVGFGIMRYRCDDAHLDLLAVAPPYRRAGIGRQLLQWLEKCAVEAGTFSIDLEVRAQNKGARSFYEQVGYRTVAELPGYYDGVETALRMGRNVSRRVIAHDLQQVEYSLPGFGLLRVPVP